MGDSRRLLCAPRYPNSLPGSIPARVYTRDAAQDAVGLAAEVVTFVRDWFSRQASGEPP